MAHGTRISDFKPSAQRLYTLTGKDDWIAQGVRAQNEFFEVASTIKRLGDRIAKDTGLRADEKLDIPWPMDPLLADALRCCMRDYPDTVVSEASSRLLLRCGFDDGEVIGALGTWGGLMYAWRKGGMTASRLQVALSGADLARELPEPARKKLEAWIAAPLSAIFSPHGTFEHDFLDVLLGPRRVHAYLNSESADPAEMFLSLFRGLDIEGKLAGAACCHEGHWQSEMDTLCRELRKQDGAQWQNFYDNGEYVVTFEFEGARYVFFTGEAGTFLDDKAILANFDSFMASAGRVERAYRIDVYQEWWDEGGHFVVGDPRRLEPVMAALGIPVLRASPEAGCTVNFGLGRGPVPYAATPTFHRCPKP